MKQKDSFETTVSANFGSEPMEIKRELTLEEEKIEGKKRWDSLREEERKMVKGKFIFNECPKAILHFSFRKYKGDPIKKYSMRDGEVYEVPLVLARHLNNNCHFPSYTYKRSERGDHFSTVSENIRRTTFQSLDFF